MNERCWNPFKKDISNDHVFLTGAGQGIGRLMAIRLGLLGCKLSLSDINFEMLKETESICIKAGVAANKICTFKCDMSQVDQVRAGA